jgi:hypothetical protein
MEKENKSKEFNEKFLGSYQQELSDPTNKNHQFDSEKTMADGQVTNPATATPTEAQQLAASVTKPADSPDLTAFGYSLVDFANALLPNGAPVGSRHKSAIKLAYDLLIVCDGDVKKVLHLLMQLPWVKDVVAERGQKEIDDIMDAAQKLKHKRESENYYELLPSKEMRRAIEQVTGRKFTALVKEIQKQALGGLTDAEQHDTTAMLERIGREIEKLFPRYPLLKLLCHRLERKYYVVALFVGGAFCMTLMTRCWYQSGMEPGRKCRLNSVLELIGRSGGGKHIAVRLYRLLMTPVRKSDEAQTAALNRWNEERDQKSGGEKNKTPRPKGIFRCMPSETSAAAIREAEFNAKEIIDGEEWPLHVSHFNSELDDLIEQMKKGYMNIEKLFLKGFHNEPDGAYLKTSSSMIGEYDVHFNAVYSGTPDALRKQTTKENFVKGRLFRITAVPLADSNFQTRKRHKYDDKDRENEAALLEWAYKFDACKGEIPCDDIDMALCEWTERRMADAEENGRNLALEDMVKRPYWHGMNYALPFIVSRHWDQMVEEGGRYKCPANFKTDKVDRQLALLIVNAHYAFQQHFFLTVGEQYYDNQEAEQASNTRHQQKTLLAYRRLPNPCTPEDIDREYAYNGNKNSINSRLKRLQDDGMLQRIRSGEDKGKYRKLA